MLSIKSPAQIVTLKELVVTLVPATAEQVAMIHSAFLELIITLLDLRSLGMYLPSKTVFTASSLFPMAHGKIAFSAFSTPGRQFDPKPAQVVHIPQDLICGPVTFELLHTLDGINIRSPLVVTYDNAVQITNLINAISCSQYVSTK